MTKYKSKIDLGIVLFIAILLGSTFAIMIINHVWAGIAINLVVIGFISYLFINTYYIINGNDLILKCGFIINMTIKIESISKIAEINSPLSSPATSLVRITIYYNTKDTVMISPKDKQIFIKQLTDINSKIDVILKKDKIYK